MKSKLGVLFVASEKFDGDLPVSVTEQRSSSKPRRESIAPKIVVCPPVEEMSKPVAAPREGRLLKALSKRLSRRSGTDADSVGSSSSNDSISCERAKSEDGSSCSASDSSSSSEPPHRRRSTVSLRRVFQSLNLTGRSHSCSLSERSRQGKKQPQPKRILRPPVTYTYVRGLSGLPTQRVPRHSVGLNR